MIGDFAATYSNVTLLYFTCVHVFQRNLSLCYLQLKLVMERKSTYGDAEGDSEGGTNPARAALSLHPQHASLGGMTSSR